MMDVSSIRGKFSLIKIVIFEMHRSHAVKTIRKLLSKWLVGLALVCIHTMAAESPDRASYSLAELQNLAVTNYQPIGSFSVTGMVCAADTESRLVVLQDDSATVLLELPHLDSDVHPGDWLKLDATQITLMRNAAGVLVGTAPVVEMDNCHRAFSRTGRVFLDAGSQPVRLEWFNGEGDAKLDVAYEGPGAPRQLIPNSALQCRASDPPNTKELQPGLTFAAYLGSNWTALPDFQSLTPVVTGTIANFDISKRPCPRQVAMRFSGYLEISTPDIYTFRLESDDGARLFVGDPASQCAITKLDRTSPPPVPKSLAQALTEPGKQEWVSLEGKVTFASRRGNQIELELMDRDRPVSVLMANSAHLPTTNLINQHLALTGISQSPSEARTPRVIVPGVKQLQIISTSRTAMNADEPVTTTAQVRGLQPDDARRKLHALIRGVVTTTTAWSCVVQDSTGPVFVRNSNDAWPHQPLVGEVWEFDGSTDPGEFSPVVVSTKATCLGKGVLPQPIHPSWEQLKNGSLDVELIELQGVVLEASRSQMRLLTPDGEVKIVNHFEYPLPYPTALMAPNQNLLGSLVHVRGVFYAWRDPATRQLVPSQFILGDARLSLDEPAPDNPYSGRTQHVADLLRFTSHVDVLSRFKVSAQVLHARPREYFLLDGANGFRIRTKEPLPLVEGDLVEAVGFPQLSGP